MYTKGTIPGFSVSSGTLKTNTYEPIPLEEELIKISSFNSITINRSLRLIEGYCQDELCHIHDVHQLIAKYYLDKSSIFEGMYLDFQQLHCDSIIICPYLGNVSMDSWNDKSFAKEQFNKINRSILAFSISIFIQFTCIFVFILLLTVSIGIIGDLSYALLGMWCSFVLINIAFWYYIWGKPYKTYLANIRHKYILLHFNVKETIVEKWTIKPHKIAHDHYVMKLHTIEKICTFEEVDSIEYVPSASSSSGFDLIRLWKDCDQNGQTKMIWFKIPKEFGSIVKQRLREFILVYLTDVNSNC